MLANTRPFLLQSHRLTQRLHQNSNLNNNNHTLQQRLRRSFPHTAATFFFSYNNHYSSVYQSKCFLQYEQTSQTMKGVNTAKGSIMANRKGNTHSEKNKIHREKSLKWMTKSTKDYMSETEAKNLSAGRAPTRNINTTSSKSEQNNTSSDIFQSQRETLSERRAVRELQRQEMSQVAEQQLEAELDRIRDDNTSRWRKSTNFFKRQGKGFLFCYLAMYVGMFSGLYFLFSSGYVRKDAAFEFVTYLFTGMIDKEKLLKRIESYDTYIDFGFAFVINEFLEFVRLPLCFFIMVTLRPLLVRKHVRPSIFRGTAAET